MVLILCQFHIVKTMVLRSGGSINRRSPVCSGADAANFQSSLAEASVITYHLFTNSENTSEYST